MADRSSLSKAVAKYLNNLVTSGRSIYHEYHREAVQTSVWVVTLASGLLTFAAVNSQLLASLSARSGNWLLGLLMSSVLLGALNRFLFYVHGHFAAKVSSPLARVTTQPEVIA